ncbi:MAG: rRNA pseudouridine synthase [Clostridia bacterium]|nr:rRNA pseudouridine synthase [Clostridia bacterium]
MRINKFLAQCGIASRRKCDEIIQSGVVTVNGKKVDLGCDVDENTDVVAVDGKIVKAKKEFSYYIMNKPKGYVCTVSDDKGRKTVMELLPANAGRVVPVGRLDYDTEGLLLFTDDGDLAFRLTHPGAEVPKTYTARIEGVLTEYDLNPIRSGIEIEKGVLTKKCKAHIIETNKAYTKVSLTITEGKNREIRKMFEAIGKNVDFLKRVKVGDLDLRGIDRGAVRKLTQEEILYLKSL